MKPGLMLAATFTLLTTSANVFSQSKPQEEELLPEVSVTGAAVDRPHPADNTYSERPLGCVEVVTPNGTGNEMGGYFLARDIAEGIPVIPSLNDPSSASDNSQRSVDIYHQGVPTGQEGKAGCAR
jgi:hypothetical protein